MDRLEVTPNRRRHAVAVLLALALALTACGSADTGSSGSGSTSAATPASGGIRLIDVDQANAILADPPPDLVILDVRTPEEFDEGHIDGAVMLDFYREDFAAELAKLDTSVPYLLYCRSGNRSGQTATLMKELDFKTVDNVDGGVVAWQEAGLPLTGG